MINIFGTDGVRNAVGNFPFTTQDLPKFGKAIAQWILEKYGTKNQIIIASDTRYSCDWIKSAINSGLLLYPISVCDIKILPTPAVFHILKQDPNYACGIVISASHNPYYDNGIKIIDSKSGKLSKADELRITELLNTDILDINYLKAGSLEYLNSEETYVNSIVTNFSNNFLKSKKIVLDTANGATYKVAPKIFDLLGADTIVINNMPTGYNINQNCGSTHIEALQKAVLANHADIGFAFDGDGDRVIAVSKFGSIKDGDDILAVLSELKDYKNTNIIGTILTNKGLQDYLEINNKKLLRTQVGDKYILEELNKNNLLLGGEQSGHIILKNIINSGDGILTALKVLEALEYSGNWDFNTFNKYPQVHLNIPVKVKKNLEDSPFAHLIDAHLKLLNNGRLIVRYSGTENLLRIMVEDPDIIHSKNIANLLASQLQEHLK